MGNIVLGSPEAAEIVQRDKERGALGAGVKGYGAPAPPKRDSDGELLEPKPQAELTVAERAELGRYEAVIGRGIIAFMEVGNALSKIRDGKLYRRDYANFEDYCFKRWGIKRQRAYELMEAASVAENLSEISDKLDLREAHVAPLAKLAPDEQREVYAEAKVTAPDGKVTAAHVQRTVERLRPSQPIFTPPLGKTTYTGKESATSESVAENPTQLAVPGTESEVTETAAEPYTGPIYVPPNVPADPAPTEPPSDEELAAMATVAEELAGEDKERAEREASRASSLTRDEIVVLDLVRPGIKTALFEAALLSATIPQLEAAMERIDSAADPMRFLKVGNRRELLLSARDVAEMVAAVEEVVVLTPPDLVAAGYTILQVGDAWGWERTGDHQLHEYKQFPLNEVITSYPGGKPFTDARTAIAEARRDMIAGIKMGPHDSYYPEKHGLAVMPADLVAAGYVLDDQGAAGKLGYCWRFGDEEGPNVAYGGAAIEGARAHYAATSAAASARTEADGDRIAAQQPALIDEPALPADLAERDFFLLQLNGGMWIVGRDAPDPYQSNRFFDPADAIEEARDYAAKYLTPTPAEPQTPKTLSIFSPKAQSLRDCLASTCDRALIEYVELFPDQAGEARAMEVAIMAMINRLDDWMHALQEQSREKEAA